jgi:hypothetical protein
VRPTTGYIDNMQIYTAEDKKLEVIRFCPEKITSANGTMFIRITIVIIMLKSQ